MIACGRQSFMYRLWILSGVGFIFENRARDHGTRSSQVSNSDPAGYCPSKFRKITSHLFNVPRRPQKKIPEGVVMNGPKTRGDIELCVLDGETMVIDG